jgi:CRISPR type III-associated protein (TIGR04423 family)
MRVTEIKKSNYQGYLWYSDKKTPESFSNKEYGAFELDATKNPFIIEGQLYDSENRISYSIKYVDGEYFINEYKVEEADLKDNDNKVSYKAHRMGKGVVLEFLQYFREVEDELCEGMKVLQPAEKVFIGFKVK